MDLREKSVSDLLKIINDQNETIWEQFQTILWQSKYIRELEAAEQARYRKYQPFDKC